MGGDSSLMGGETFLIGVWIRVRVTLSHPKAIGLGLRHVRSCRSKGLGLPHEMRDTGHAPLRFSQRVAKTECAWPGGKFLLLQGWRMGRRVADARVTLTEGLA